VTSLVRVRLGERAWRAVHGAAYACWPLAVAHGLGSGSDVRSRWLLAVMAGAALAAVAAVVWRAIGVGSTAHRRQWIVVGTSVIVPVALAGFAVIGPLAPHWAARAGTPATLLAAKPIARASPSPGVTPSPAASVGVRGGVATFAGRAVVRRRGRYVVVFTAALRGAVAGRLSITLTGHSVPRRGIELSAGTAAYHNGALSFRGVVTSIQGEELAATLTGSTGRIRLRAHVVVAKSLAFTGRVTLS